MSSTAPISRRDFFGRGVPRWISHKPSVGSTFLATRRSLRRWPLHCGPYHVTCRGEAPLDASQVEDQRGRGGFGGGVGGPVIVGGGGIGLVILLVSLLLGVNPLSDYTATSPSVDGAPSVQDCQTGADANKRDDCRIVGFVDSVQKYWGDEFARRAHTYLPANPAIDTDSTEGACGFAQAAMGPFYCPDDEKVYLD